MSFFVVGLNHRTAPIEVREKFFFTELQRELCLSELRHNPAIIEGFVLSTCNRTELYVRTINETKTILSVLRLLYQMKKVSLIRRLHPQDARPRSFRDPCDSRARQKGGWLGADKKHFYLFKGEQAIRHLFCVTTGLDSLVLGEKEILGQVKSAVAMSRSKGMIGKYLNILTNRVITAGKKVHNETDIGFGGASVSWAAVTMAEKLLGGFAQKEILIMGAGKMGNITMSLLQRKGANQVFVMNRTPERACEMTGRLGGVFVSFSDIKEILNRIDLCICSVGAPHHIIEKPMMEKVLASRQGRPLVLIDISMPRNIDPAISHLPGVDLVYIDDLDHVVEDNMERRKKSIRNVEEIIEQKMSDFYHRLARLQELNPEEYSEAISKKL